jgi:predicted ribosome quality control (RQC) complex YloA/Tae2 family protein
MAFDGAFLHRVGEELKTAIGCKVDKVCQPARDELILILRSKEFNGKLLLSANANSPRVHFTSDSPENPLTPPMFCMLLRKRLCGGRLTAVRQPGLERVLLLDFSCINELGDTVIYTIAVEIMGRYSNIILSADGKIVDAIKRVDASMTSERLVLPGMNYELPPAQDKLNLLCTESIDVCNRIMCEKPAMLHKTILKTLQGVSPIVCRELQYEACRGEEPYSNELTPAQLRGLMDALDALRARIEVTGPAYMISDSTGKPFDFTFWAVQQYGNGAAIAEFDSPSQLLDAYYSRRDKIERMRTRAHDLTHTVSNAIDKLSRKINLQMAELENCAQREELRICADLLNANLYRLKGGESEAVLENYYEENCPLKHIPLDPALSPSRNAQKYYKEYRKAQTAETILTEQIEQATGELAYLETVADALTRAENERELNEIRQELMEQGYVRKSADRKKPAPLLKARSFRTTDGFTVLVGRNNRENDQLTLKQSSNNDLWFHVKNMPGSHTILVTEGRTPTAQAITEAAMLAAYHSKASASAQVPVDYTQVRHVHKPQGAKPGKVIYDHYTTAYVTPDEKMVERLTMEGKN